MKKIINGKKYDTETATFLAERQYSYPGQFQYCLEELYIKKTKEFFLSGEGGARSKYAEICGQNEKCGGKNIIPLTEVEAKKWIEENANSDFEKIFGQCEE